MPKHRSVFWRDPCISRTDDFHWNVQKKACVAHLYGVVSVKNLSHIIWPTADHRARQRDAAVQTLNHRSSILTVDSSTVPFSYFYPEFIEIWEVVIESCVSLITTDGYNEWNLITVVINGPVQLEKKVKKVMMWNIIFICVSKQSSFAASNERAWKVLIGTNKWDLNLQKLQKYVIVQK